MGLPCAHKLESWKGMSLSLELIHPQWRIDMFSLNSEDNSQNDGANIFTKLLDELNSKYKVWPLNKKEFATTMITQLLSESDTFFEPLIKRPKGRPPKSKKKRGPTSTTRDPSRFELVEARTHHPSSSTSTHRRSNEVIEEINGICQESNVIDLNVCPDFPDDFMFLG